MFIASFAKCMPLEHDHFCAPGNSRFSFIARTCNDYGLGSENIPECCYPARYLWRIAAFPDRVQKITVGDAYKQVRIGNRRLLGETLSRSLFVFYAQIFYRLNAATIARDLVLGIRRSLVAILTWGVRHRPPQCRIETIISTGS